MQRLVEARMKKQLCSSFLAASIVVGSAIVAHAQSGPAVGAADAPAWQMPRATTGSALEQRRDDSPVGKIDDAAKAGPGVVGPDRSLPAPRIRGEPHRRCLAPYPICP
jgi:hypothetical protein